MRATKKIISALPLIICLFILGLFLFIFIGKKVSAKTILASEKVSLILRLIQDPNSKKIDVSDAVATRRTALSAPKTTPNSTHRDVPYGTSHSLILSDDTTKKEILSIPLRFISEIHGVPPLPRSGETSGTPPKKLLAPYSIVEIPYAEGLSLSIRDQTGRTLYHLPRERINRALRVAGDAKREGPPTKRAPLSGANEEHLLGVTRGRTRIFEDSSAPKQNPPPTFSDGYFDVLFISSHYTDRTKFYSDTEAMGNFLLTVAPASDLKSKIRIQRLFTTESLGCGYDTFITRLITCDEMKVFEVASSTPHDTIVVVENNNKYGGSGGLIAVSYRDVSAWAKEVVVHEMGHSVGDLADEYEYGYNYSGTSDPGYPNCSKSPCKWQGVDGTGCYKGCSYNNLYRPTFNSCLMRTLTPDNGFKFDNVDREVMRQIISSYLLEIPPTPTTQLVTQPSSTPTLTPTPTPSPTPFPTKKPTPTPTIYKFKIKWPFKITTPIPFPTISFIRPTPIKLRGR